MKPLTSRSITKQRTLGKSDLSAVPAWNRGLICSSREASGRQSWSEAEAYRPHCLRFPEQPQMTVVCPGVHKSSVGLLEHVARSVRVSSLGGGESELRLAAGSPVSHNTVSSRKERRATPSSSSRFPHSEKQPR